MFEIMTEASVTYFINRDAVGSGGGREREREREGESERASGGESLEGAGSREICLLCVTSPWDDPVIIMNVLVVPRISSSSPLSPSASPFNLVEGILDASFHRFSFFFSPRTRQSSVDRFRFRNPNPSHRIEDSGKDKLELLYRRMYRTPYFRSL